jgi:two-component system NarL family response regulator
MDFSMPGMDGVEATRRLCAELPHVQVIGLSMYDERDRAAAMIEAGAAAYLTKSGNADVLIETIRMVHAGAAAETQESPEAEEDSTPTTPASK